MKKLNRLVESKCETCDRCFREGFMHGQYNYAGWYECRSKVIKDLIERVRKTELDKNQPVHDLIMAVESLWNDPEKLLRKK